MIISLKNHIEEIVQEKDSANIAGKYPKPDQEQDELNNEDETIFIQI